jgi:hypothetical protein
MDATEDASFAAIRARNRLGIAIAAIMRMGIIEIPKYPNISPVKAIPAPRSRPLLLRISEREMWPRTMATIAAGNKNPKTPAIKLPIAFPLVSPGPTGNAAGTVVGLGGEVGAPQLPQNWLLSASVVPQLEQT